MRPQLPEVEKLGFKSKRRQSVLLETKVRQSSGGRAVCLRGLVLQDFWTRSWNLVREGLLQVLEPYASFLQKGTVSQLQ